MKYDFDESKLSEDQHETLDDCVIERDGKFYFYDETWSDLCGPYDTYDDANTACNAYVAMLTDGIVRSLNGGTWVST